MSPKSFGLVVHLHDRLSARGGADRHLWGVLDELQPDLATELLVGWDDDSLPKSEKASIGPWSRLKGLERGGLNQRGAEAARQRLQQALAQRNPTVIHVHNVMDPQLLQVAALTGPSLLTIQDHRYFCPGPGKLWPDDAICRQVMSEACLDCFDDADYGRMLLALTKARLRAAAKMCQVLVLSNYMAGELLTAWRAEGMKPPRIKVLPPFVHGLQPMPRMGPGDYHLLVSRLVERKGVRKALTAARSLELPLWVAGDGTMRAEVEQASLESGGRVRYVGWADREKLARLLAGARSLWLPSLWAEPFGIAGLEALSVGVPVVASRVGGIPEWLDNGRDGFLVPPGDVKELVRAARRLEQDHGLAAEMGRAGAERVAQEFASGPLMKKLKEFYSQVASVPLGEST